MYVGWDKIYRICATVFAAVLLNGCGLQLSSDFKDDSSSNPGDNPDPGSGSEKIEFSVFDGGTFNGVRLNSFGQIEPLDSLNSQFPDNAVSTGWFDMTDNVLLLHMDEDSGAIADTSGVGNNGAMTGAVIYEKPGVMGTALHFDGASNNYVMIADDPSINPASWTITAWFKIDGVTAEGSQNIISKMFSTSSIDYQMDFNQPEESFRCHYENGGTNVVAEDATVQVSLGAFHFGVCSYDAGTGKLRAYLDGVLIEEQDNGGTLPPNSTGNAVIGINSNTLTDNQLNGDADELAMFDRALTPAEITQIYEKQAPEYVIGQLPDHARSAGYVDMTGNVLLLHMNEPSSGDIKDSSGLGNDGVVTGAVAYGQSGKVATALGFDGVNNNYVSIPDDPSLNPASWTISSWFKVEAVTADSQQKILHKENISGERDFMMDFNQPEESFRCGYRSGGTTVSAEDISKQVSKGAFHFGVCTYDASTNKLRAFLDGVLIEEQDGGGISPPDTTADVAIGISSTVHNGDRFNGEIDEVAMWGRPLSQTEIQTIFEKQRHNFNDKIWTLDSSWIDTTNLEAHWKFDELNVVDTDVIKDSSVNGSDGVLSTGEASNHKDRKGYVGGAIEFDGANDQVLVGNPPNLDLTGAIVVSSWVYPTANQEGHLVNKGDPSSGVNRGWRLQSDAGAVSPSWKFSVSGDCNVSVNSANTSELALNQWHYIVGVFDPGIRQAVYVNGELAAETLAVPAVACNSIEPVRIGQRSGGSQPFAGKLDEISVWSRVLTDAEIKSIFDHQSPKYTGVFESKIYDAGGTSSWDALEVTPEAPYMKEFNGSESSYDLGNLTTTGLFAHWRLNGAVGANVSTAVNQIVDSSAQASHGTATDGGTAMVFQEGRLGQGIQFDGVDDYVEVALVPTVFEDSHSISLWAKTTSDALMAVMDQENAGDTRGPLSLNFSSGGVFANLRDQASTTVGASTTDFYNDGAWHHILIIRDGNDNSSVTFSLYIDGILKDSQTGPILDTSAGGEPLQIGRRSPAGTREFEGSIDEIMVYSRVLTGPEIQALYTRGAARLRYQVRSCDDPACSGESWSGETGPGSYFSELLNSLTELPVFSSLGIGSAKYFQYRVFFDADSAEAIPRLNDVVVKGAK